MANIKKATLKKISTKLIKILKAENIQTYCIEIGPDNELIESITYRRQATGNRQQAAGNRRQAASRAGGPTGSRQIELD